MRACARAEGERAAARGRSRACEQGRLQQQPRWHGDGVCAAACACEAHPSMRPEVLVRSCSEAAKGVYSPQCSRFPGSSAAEPAPAPDGATGGWQEQSRLGENRLREPSRAQRSRGQACSGSPGPDLRCLKQSPSRLFVRCGWFVSQVHGFSVWLHFCCSVTANLSLLNLCVCFYLWVHKPTQKSPAELFLSPS